MPAKSTLRHLRAPLLRTTAAAALAAGLFAAMPAAHAQSPGMGTPMNSLQSRMTWAEDQVFQALENNMGTEGYFDAMEAISDVLDDYGLIDERIENFYDRRAGWHLFTDAGPSSIPFHNILLDTLRRNRGAPAYWEAMEAAADELGDQDMISDSAEAFFDRMNRRAGWNTYGFYDRR